MMTRRFNVVRLEFWIDQAFDHILSAEPSIALQTCAIEGAAEPSKETNP